MTLKGILFGAGAFALLLGATSASLPLSASPQGLLVGDVLPKMKSLDVGGRLSKPASDAPAYRLIHFWASYDAESRAENQVWEHFFAARPLPVHYVGVALDPDRAVWERTIVWDQLDQAHQHCLPQSEHGDYLSEAGLTQGLHSYLVDAQGVIVAVDPTPEELANYL